jgi:hypothetical protein
VLRSGRNASTAASSVTIHLEATRCEVNSELLCTAVPHVSLRELLRALPVLYLGCAPYKRYVQKPFLLIPVNARVSDFHDHSQRVRFF